MLALAIRRMSEENLGAIIALLALVIKHWLDVRGRSKNNKVLNEVRKNTNGNMADAVARAENEARRTAPRVLIIDDDKDDIELAARVLRKFGCDIFEARTAAEAERLLMSYVGSGRGFPFDFALLDLKMPGDDAREVFKVFNGKARMVPIIVLTGRPQSLREFDPSNIPRVQIEKPLLEAQVQNIFEERQIPYHKPEAHKETPSI